MTTIHDAIEWSVDHCVLNGDNDRQMSPDVKVSTGEIWKHFTGRFADDIDAILTDKTSDQSADRVKLGDGNGCMSYFC